MVGAFTGARANAAGLVAAAEGGTLFLDEVNSLTAPAQVKLLRLLQGKEYRRLGETFLRRADVRFVAASNCDLFERVEQGTFREDLFYRLRVVQVQVEPLRRRREDIQILACVFLERYAKQYGLPPVELSEAAWDRLRNYPWRGNVRELENCIHGLICRQPERRVEPADLALVETIGAGSAAVAGPEETARPATAGAGVDPDLLSRGLREAKREAVDRLEAEYVREALRRSDGNIARAARLARKNRRAFFELMRKHRIDAREYRQGPASPDAE
jgi:two-component system response regulator GlrR